jgi:hypothetical protein
MRQTQTARLLQQTMTTSTCRTLPRVRLVVILLHHSKIPRKPSSSNQGHSGPARCARQSRRQLRQPKISQISRQPCFLAEHPETAQHARPSRRQLHQPCLLAGPSEPKQRARPSRRQLRQSKTSQTSQQPCFLAGHPEPAQHARPSRRQLHQPKILRQPYRLVEHSEPAQHARPSRPSRRMRSPLAGRSDPALYARPSRRMRCLLFQLPHVHRHAAHRPPRPRECLTSHSASYERKKAAAAASSSFPGSQHPNHTALPRPPTQSSPQRIHPAPPSSACRQSSSSRSPNTS